MSSDEREIAKVLEKRIDLTDFDQVYFKGQLITMQKLLEKYKALSIVYLEDGCQPCLESFISWHELMDSVSKPNGYSILFVIQCLNLDRFLQEVNAIKQIDSPFYLIEDPHYSYIESNGDIPRWIIDRSITIDSCNRIKMVGAPFASEQMKNIFNEIYYSL